MTIFGRYFYSYLKCIFLLVAFQVILLNDFFISFQIYNSFNWSCWTSCEENYGVCSVTWWGFSYCYLFWETFKIRPHVGLHKASALIIGLYYVEFPRCLMTANWSAITDTYSAIDYLPVQRTNTLLYFIQEKSEKKIDLNFVTNTPVLSQNLTIFYSCMSTHFLLNFSCDSL